MKCGHSILYISCSENSKSRYNLNSNFGSKEKQIKTPTNNEILVGRFEFKFDDIYQSLLII